MFLYLITTRSIAERGNDVGKPAWSRGPAVATLSCYTSGPQWGWFRPPGDIGRCLGTLLVVTPGEEGATVS